MDSLAHNTVKLEQVISSLDARYTGEDNQEIIETLWYKDVFSIDEEGNTVIEIPAHLHHVLLGSRVKAFMARPSGETLSADDDKSNVCSDYSDCGASMNNHWIPGEHNRCCGEDCSSRYGRKWNA